MARSSREEWPAAFKRACRRHKMRFVSEEGFFLDDVYITALAQYPAGPEAVGWKIWIKPLALDEVLWAAFMPDVVMGRTMQINRRINGAFQIHPLTLEVEIRPTADLVHPDEFWDAACEHFLAVRAGFIARHPTVADFLTVVHGPDDDPARPVHLLREITTLIAVGETARAASLADDALARGVSGGMSSGADVFELLSAYAKGADAYAALMVSLTPTHTLERIREDRPSTTVGLARGRHRGRFRDDLNQFDGHSMWAMILKKRPPPGSESDQTAVRYLQAAGSAEAMTVEIREPGGEAWGAVSVRSKIGWPAAPTVPGDIAIPLPRITEMVRAAEVFTAEQTATLFEAYYLTDAIPDGHSLRPVEGYAADGGYLQPPDPGR
jgi:hypothetical protein